EARLLGRGDRVERADRPAARGLAAELERAVDRRGVRLRRVRAVRRGRPVGRGADAPRVEELLAPDVSGGQVKAEQIAALDEERPLLLEEGLDVGEVDDRGIGIDLSEIRVDGAGQGEAAAQA